MLVWGDNVHESHEPDEPRNIGFGSAMVHCLACGVLLRSSHGVSVNPKVAAPCQPRSGASQSFLSASTNPA